MNDLNQAVRHIADHVQMPAAERARLEDALGAKPADQPRKKKEAKRKSA